MRAVETVGGIRLRRIAHVARIVRIAVAPVAVIAHARIGHHVPARHDVGRAGNVRMRHLQAGIDHGHHHAARTGRTLTVPERLEPGAPGRAAVGRAPVPEMPLQRPERIVRIIAHRRRGRRSRPAGRSRPASRRGRRRVLGTAHELVLEDIVRLDILELAGRPQVAHHAGRGQRQVTRHVGRQHVRRAFRLVRPYQKVGRSRPGAAELRRARAIGADLDDHLALPRQRHFAADAVLRHRVQHHRVRVDLRLDRLAHHRGPPRQLAHLGLFLDRQRLELLARQPFQAALLQRRLGHHLVDVGLRLRDFAFGFRDRFRVQRDLRQHLLREHHVADRRARHGGLRGARRRRRRGFKALARAARRLLVIILFLEILEFIGRELGIVHHQGRRRRNVYGLGDDRTDGEQRAFVLVDHELGHHGAGQRPVGRRGRFEVARARIDNRLAADLARRLVRELLRPVDAFTDLVTARKQRRSGQGRDDNPAQPPVCQSFQHVGSPHAIANERPSPIG